MSKPRFSVSPNGVSSNVGRSMVSSSLLQSKKNSELNTGLFEHLVCHVVTNEDNSNIFLCKEVLHKQT